MLSRIRSGRGSSLICHLRRGLTIQSQKLSERVESLDQESHYILTEEKKRQKYGVNLIASENHCSQAVLDALSSPFLSKSSTGQVGSRIESGQKFADQLESLTQKRALEAFDLDPEKWGVNIQSYSGAHANFNIYSGLLNAHDRILSLDLPHGGHLSHGYQLKNKKISHVSTFFESLPYRQNEKLGQIDYDEVEMFANRYNPKIIIAGASAYAKLLDYKKFKEIADQVGAYVLADVAHISGLIIAKAIPSPFDHVDIVSTTTHKSMRGPRGSMIFYRKGVRSEDKKGKQTMYDLESKIQKGISLHQGSAHLQTIGAIGVALKQANTPEFREYQQQVMRNSKAMAERFLKLDYDLVGGGTENHLCLVDLRRKQIDGSRLESLLDRIFIFGNKNTVPGDKSALVPSGYRVGAPAMTSRGLVEKDFQQIVDFINRAVQISLKIKKETGSKLVDFKAYLQQNANEHRDIQNLRNEVQQFSGQFPLPAVNDV